MRFEQVGQSVKCKLALAAACLLAMCTASASHSNQSSAANLPVTNLEANSVLATITHTMNRVLALKPKLAPPAGGGASHAAAARSRIIEQLHRLYLAAAKKFTFKSRPVKFNTAKLKLPATGRTMAQAKEMIAWGLIAPVGPLVTGPSEGIKPQDFGDALGFFIARVAELTHVPSRKFSPYLMPMEEKSFPQPKGGG